VSLRDAGTLDSSELLRLARLEQGLRVSLH
jgi:hypothetical protein